MFQQDNSARVKKKKKKNCQVLFCTEHYWPVSWGPLGTLFGAYQYQFCLYQHIEIRIVANIFLMTFSIVFSWMRSILFLSKFHWNFIIRIQLIGVQITSSSTYQETFTCPTSKILHFFNTDYINGIVCDCIIYIANVLEILQSDTKPLIYDLEENFAQIHLADWQFYLPRAIRKWDLSSPG